MRVILEWARVAVDVKKGNDDSGLSVEEKL